VSHQKLRHQVREGDELVVARGGRGGRGNEAFKTPRTKAPRMAEKGEPGHEHWLQVGFA